MGKNQILATIVPVLLMGLSVAFHHWLYAAGTVPTPITYISLLFLVAITIAIGLGLLAMDYRILVVGFLFFANQQLSFLAGDVQSPPWDDAVITFVNVCVLTWYFRLSYRERRANMLAPFWLVAPLLGELLIAVASVGLSGIWKWVVIQSTFAAQIGCVMYVAVARLRGNLPQFR